jgi:Fe-S-cluster containining protein
VSQSESNSAEPNTAEPSDEQLAERWRRAAADDRIATALLTIYDDIATKVNQRGPACWASGRCCNFEAFGHRLYVTGLEAALAQRLATTAATPQAVQVALTKGGCPFQDRHLCAQREARPLGCRVFFCDKSSTQWQHELMEHGLERIRALHDDFAIPYRYAEWRAMLQWVGVSTR